VSKEAFIFEVNQKTFDQHVLLNSHKIPVIVQFMGVWSGPCAAMDMVFSGLAREFAEQFIFAKVDVDEQPELRTAHNIENVPTLLVFKDGKLVRTEAGELKEDEARALLKDFGIISEADLKREQAREKHMAGETPAAIVLLTDAIKSDPSNTRVAMDMVQIFIDISELEQAEGLFSRLPEATRETEMGKALNSQLAFARLASKTDNIETLQSRIAANAEDYDAHFDLAVRLIDQFNYSDAVDSLFYIQQNNASYKDGAAKEMIILIANMIAPSDNEFAQEIRRRLANQLTD